MIRVLLADDADEMRYLVRLALEMDGRFDVVGEAADGVEAIELLGREQPDAMVLDMAMPRMDGLQVLAEMRVRGMQSKVLALSGFNGPVRDKATALGANDYVRKGSTTISELVPRLLALFA
jgi:CheY-like chemotaxis protein